MAPPNPVPMMLTPEDLDRVLALEEALDALRGFIADWPTMNIVEASQRVEELKEFLTLIPEWKSSA